MKCKALVSLIFVLVFISCIQTAVWGGQVITGTDRAWAQRAVEQEKTLDVEQCPPNTVAIIYFFNQTGDSRLDPLRKGIALMLITDLSKLDQIQVVERTRLQALMEELDLGTTGLVDPETTPRVGKLLCARVIVGGEILTGKTAQLQLSSDMLDVPTTDIFGQASAEGDLAQLFSLEKEILFDIVEQLNLKLSPAQKAELEKPLSLDTEALMLLFQGLEMSDRKNYNAASSLYEKALNTDPNLALAAELSRELRTLGLLRTSNRSRNLLNSLRDKTSLTDRVVPDYPIRRFRTPDDVERRRALLPDSDNDGVPDTMDGCPDDPQKTQPGECGCGTPDTDSDQDGILDCNDNCPNDDDKIEPGVCGCGTADIDSDQDGTPECNDNCPNDPDKTQPGDCGCGKSDIDSDGDGTSDCIDGCPNDPNKTSPGDCGCGVEDVDMDGDGKPKCIDGCPDDPEKTEPGDCGCGEPDIDSDNDGTADCLDECPEDPEKVEPADCGCNEPEIDTDSDSTPDCIDSCPEDPNKTEPGDCGCGEPDIDSDGDGTSDCMDECPQDPNKIEPGDCGCSEPDEDSDNDGVADCEDNCPFDANKVDPGICGCGVSDGDSDNDGIINCRDGCPADPLKVSPGVCGCGTEDSASNLSDGDGDGIPLCLDECPNFYDPTNNCTTTPPPFTDN